MNRAGEPTISPVVATPRISIARGTIGALAAFVAAMVAGAPAAGGEIDVAVALVHPMQRAAGADGRRDTAGFGAALDPAPATAAGAGPLFGRSGLLDAADLAAFRRARLGGYANRVVVFLHPPANGAGTPAPAADEPASGGSRHAADYVFLERGENLHLAASELALYDPGAARPGGERDATVLVGAVSLADICGLDGVRCVSVPEPPALLLSAVGLAVLFVLRHTRTPAGPRRPPGSRRVTHFATEAADG